MTLPIWPVARRCIQTKKPMISTNGSSRLSQPNSQLVVGCLEVELDAVVSEHGLVGLADASLAAAGGGELVAVLGLAGDLAVALLIVTLSTLPVSTCANSV